MTGNDSPKVSVCIPTYNYGKFIVDAIESVLVQTFENFELIVVDNCSVDETRKIVNTFISKDERISYFCNEKNIGMVGNWNRCLELARGEYVKILCADDFLEPDCLRKSIEMLERYPNIALVSSARGLVSERLEPMGVRTYSETLEHIKGHDVISRCFIDLNQIGEPTAVLFKKKLAIRGFQPSYQHLTDLEMWFHLLEQGDFAFTPEVLCRLRLHAEQETNANIRLFSTVKDEFALMIDYGNKKYLRISSFDRFDRIYNVAYILWQHCRLTEARTQVKLLICKLCNWPLFILFCMQKRLKKFINKQSCDKENVVDIC